MGVSCNPEDRVHCNLITEFVCPLPAPFKSISIANKRDKAILLVDLETMRQRETQTKANIQRSSKQSAFRTSARNILGIGIWVFVNCEYKNGTRTNCRMAGCFSNKEPRNESKTYRPARPSYRWATAAPATATLNSPSHTCLSSAYSEIFHNKAAQ